MELDLIYRKKDYIAFIKLNRPKKLNALTSTMMQNITNTITEADLDKEVKSIIICGSPKSFCAGGDIEEEKEMSPLDALEFGFHGQKMTNAIQFCKKPVIAAISGYALGGGLELALACDFRICSSDSVFGFPEVTLSVTTAIGGTPSLIRTIGISKAKEMVMLGKKINASEAHNLGLVNKVTDRNSLMKSSLELAEDLAKIPQISLALFKLMANRFSESANPNHLFIEAITNAFCYSLQDKSNAYEDFFKR